MLTPLKERQDGTPPSHEGADHTKASRGSPSGSETSDDSERGESQDEGARAGAQGTHESEGCQRFSIAAMSAKGEKRRKKKDKEDGQGATLPAETLTVDVSKAALEIAVEAAVDQVQEEAGARAESQQVIEAPGHGGQEPAEEAAAGQEARPVIEEHVAGEAPAEAERYDCSSMKMAELRTALKEFGVRAPRTAPREKLVEMLEEQWRRALTGPQEDDGRVRGWHAYGPV